jgi:aspartyl-tRNA synthetase
MPLQRMKYKRGDGSFRSDKPDIRFGFELVNYKRCCEKTAVSLYSNRL